MSSEIEQLAEFVGEADLQVLCAALEEHKLHDLAQILLGCEDPGLRAAIVAEVVAVLPEYPDQAIVVALAEVAYKQEEATRADPEEHGS